jgi:hypothetical protein
LILEFAEEKMWGSLTPVAYPVQDALARYRIGAGRP